MYEQYINIYQAARNAAGLTQERAAELLGMSVESIKAYERDTTVPKDATVLKMVDIYCAPFLAVQHLRASTELARSIIPEISEMNLQSAAITLLNRIEKFSENNRVKELLKIAEDNTINEDERVIYDQIISELNEIVKAAMTLRYIQEVV